MNALATVSPELFGPYTGRKSLTMIVKDEEANLADCLRPVIDLFDEFIIVDTGSTDRTKEVALSFGPAVKVFDFPWCDNFAAARNEALRHATGDWVFWLDADDRLDDANRDKLRVLLAGLANDNAAYSMKRVDLPDPTTRGTTVVNHVRLFRRHDLLRWEYRVHEQIAPAIRALGGELRRADVIIIHIGYQDRALLGQKLQRNLRLLQQDAAERPDDPLVLYYVGLVRKDQGQREEAIQALRCSLSVCLQHYPHDAWLLFNVSVELMNLGDFAPAEACFRVLVTATDLHRAALVPGIPAEFEETAAALERVVALLDRAGLTLKQAMQPALAQTG